MCLRFPKTVAFAAAVLLFGSAFATAERSLRVCADANNLPYSNEAGEGFENRIAELVAEALDAKLSYFWWAQRRGFVRNTLNAGQCDVIVGVPLGMEMLRTTRPYYASSYAFVRRAGSPEISSFADPKLKEMKIGVQIVGDDGVNTPPVHELAARGLAGNVRGYTVYGDYAKPSPTASVVEAVAKGDVDTAIVWGPIAGYFAKQQATQLVLAPAEDGRLLAETFKIAMGVRKDDEALAAELNRIIDARRADIEAILREYGVPLSNATDADERQ